MVSGAGPDTCATHSPAFQTPRLVCLASHPVERLGAGYHLLRRILESESFLQLAHRDKSFEHEDFAQPSARLCSPLLSQGLIELGACDEVVLVDEERSEQRELWLL